MIFLDQFAKGRDNNFNLIRAVAAVAVLVSHAYPIALGAKAVQPLEAALGHSLGAIAVFVFFVLSGYLISASFERSASPKAFWQARILRLAPCLVVSLGLVGLVMGPMVSSLPVTEYLAHPDTWSFLARNLTLALPQYELPGVFEANPYRTVEGSIWTLFHEVACYGMVFALGLAGVLRKARLMAGFLLAYAVAWGLTAALPVDLPTKAEQFRMMSFPFVVGMAFYVWRARLAAGLQPPGRLFLRALPLRLPGAGAGGLALGADGPGAERGAGPAAHAFPVGALLASDRGAGARAAQGAGAAGAPRPRALSPALRRVTSACGAIRPRPARAARG